MFRRKNKVVVYAAVTGNYDTLLSPKHIVSEWLYVCFSDSFTPAVKPWVIQKLENIDHLSSVKKARYIKTHPHELFREQEIVIWCDANILIRGDLRELVEKFIKEKALFAAITHPYRKCTYREARTCKQLKKDSEKIIDAQMRRYRDEDFPEDAGMFETGFFITRPHEPKMKETFGIWWNEIEKGSHRDQLSVMYAFKKTGVKILPLFEPGISVRNHPSFSHFQHRKGNNGSKQRIQKKSS